MHRPTRLKMTDLNPHFTCVLCDGYFVDATTIVECLHSFCRACIVKYLETNKFCPVCDVQVHKTKPLLSIRSDKTLQDVVYKLVPSLYQNEMKRRREFYADHPEEAARCTSEERGEGANQRFIYTPDETISLSMEYCSRVENEEDPAGAGDVHESELDSQVPPRRYLQCPAAITVGHLKKFITAKYNLPSSYRVEVTYSGDVIDENYTLMDIAYIYAWRRSGPMRFFYRIVTCFSKRRKLSHPVADPKPAPAADVPPSTPAVNSLEIPKKSESGIPALSLIPSPSSSKQELKFVLRTRRDEKPSESPAHHHHHHHHHHHQQQQPGTPREQKEMPALSTDTAQSESSISRSDVRHDEPSPRLIVTLPTGCGKQHSGEQRGEQDGSTPISTACHGVAENFVSASRSPVQCRSLPTPTSAGGGGCMVQPVVSQSYCSTAAVPKTTASKRSARFRVKNRSVTRPLLAKLAPYPPRTTTSPVTTALTNPAVNHFTPAPVTCFAAPPATCLSTQPVNCLGSVSVNYLTSPSVTCFGSPSVSSHSNVNTSSNLVPATMNSVPASMPLLPVTKSASQTSMNTLMAPETTRALNKCTHMYANSAMVTPVGTSVPACVTQSPTAANVCISTGIAAGLHSVGGQQVQETDVIKHCVSNTDITLRGSVTRGSSPGKQLAPTTTAVTTVTGLPVVSTVPSTTVTTAAVVANSLPVPCTNMPVISAESATVKSTAPVPLTSSITTARANSVSAAAGSVATSFSVSNLVPNTTCGKILNGSTSDTPLCDDPSLARSVSAPKQTGAAAQTASSSPRSKEAGTPRTNGVRTPDSSEGHETQTNLPENVTTPPVSANEKNAINVPFKEVKSSITAEFSDNDDLGCQPDLVVDEQKLDSSDNEEDETDDALRRKITAIAEKDDEVDVDIDTETDSGRASDISNQARSSCDDDIGSPMPTALTTADVEQRTIPVTSSAVVTSLPSTLTTATSSVSVNSAPSSFSPVTSPVSPARQSRQEEAQLGSKPNGIDHIINNLHRNHERKDNIGALDLSTSSRKTGQEDSPRPRPRPVANPPVLDAKHRQQTCLPAPTKQHTACVPVPKHPTSSTFHIGALSASARHGLMAAAGPQHLSKLSPVTIPHFSASPMMNSLSVKSSPPTNAHFCRTPPTPITMHVNPGVSAFQGKACAPVGTRQGKSNSAACTSSSLAVTAAAPPPPPSNSYHRKSPSINNSASSVASPRRDSVSPRHSLSPSTQAAASPHHRLSPCATPPKANPPSPTTTAPGTAVHMLPPVPSTSSYKISRPPIPIYNKKSDSSYKNSHHHRFKGSNLTVINPDPNGYSQKIVIKNLDPRPNNHSSHHNRL